MHSRLYACLLLLAMVAVPLSAQPVTVGEHVIKRLETPHPYAAPGTDSHQLVWVDEIQHPGAIYIAPHFAKMHLAPGDYVIVRSPDGEQSWRYTLNGRHGLGATPAGFFATHIRGDTAIVELWASGSFDPNSFGYVVDLFGRGFNADEIAEFWALGLGEKMNLPYPADQAESLCGADDSLEAKCYMVSEPAAYDTSRAVTRLLQNGSAHCTGWLVGNEGHVMTNEHCIGSQGQLDNIDFEFMAEGADCATNCQSSLACPGTIEASGGTLIQNDAPLDYALVLPDTSTASGTNLPATYGFMRLRDTLPAVGERVYHPQHPAGWGKKIAMAETHPLATATGGFSEIFSISEPACAAGGPPDIGYYTDTQGGSSGSPVLGYSDNRVVALHHCRGNAACSASGGDPNRGVPIPDIIADLGANVPAGAVCDPIAEPTGTSAVVAGANQINVSWVAPPVDGVTEYNVYRAIGACPGSAYEFVGTTIGTTYMDTTVSGGTEYSYVVRTAGAGGCESADSTCSSATATGLCIRAPDFDGDALVITNQGTAQCGLEVEWTAATRHCGSNTVYNVYRSDTPDFEPGPANEIATCVSGTTYIDNLAASGTEFFYTVRAEDDSGNGSGACAGGNEDSNSGEASGVATGPEDIQFEDDMESGTTEWSAVPGPGDPGGTLPFAQVTTNSNSPTTSWFTDDIASVKDQTLEMVNAIDLTSLPGALLEFWHDHNMENNFDGGVLEVSIDGGTTWVDILDGNPDRFIEGGYANTISTTFMSPIAGRAAWSGDSAGFFRTVVDLSDFAGNMVSLRWRLACDTSVSDEGWYIDDVKVSVLQACSTNEIFQDGFESGNISAWSFQVP